MIIFKETLRIVDEQTIEIPEGATILSSQFQSDSLKIWYFCNEKAPLVARNIFIFGTGNPIDLPLRDARFISTVQRDGFVWHVFEQI